MQILLLAVSSLRTEEIKLLFHTQGIFEMESQIIFKYFVTFNVHKIS